jgi:hypothetical protein
MTRGFGSPAHLAGRFFAALWPGGPPAEKERWALEALLPGEQELWHRMSGPDRRHAVAVAERALALLQMQGHRAVSREVVAAALLHDVGKVEAGLGTFSRVGVTLAAIAFGRERLCGPGSSASLKELEPHRAGAHARRRRLRRRVALYLTHDEVGAGLLRRAGSDEFTVEWARQHHLPPERWGLSPALAHALKEADGD